MDKLNFEQYLESVARRRPEKPAVIFEGTTYTYAQLKERMDRLASSLISLGVKYQDRVGLLCHNCNQYYEAVFACAKIGAVCAQYNWRQSAREFCDVVRQSEPAVILFSARFADLYKAARLHCPDGLLFVAVDGTLDGTLPYEELLDHAPLATDHMRGGGEDILLQLYTSGTTGQPKSVMLSHRAVITHALCNIADCRWREQDVFVCTLPLFHASSSGSYNTLLVGGTIVVHTKFRELPYLESVQRYRATRLSLTPTMLRMLLHFQDLAEYDLSSVECIVYGAAPINQKVLNEAVQRFNCDFYQLYGMTEMSPTVAVLKPEHHTLPDDTGTSPQRIYSAGQPAMGVEVRVLDEHGAPCPAGQGGEVVVRGDGMMSGYHKQPEASAAVIENGWYYTGDMGKFDEEGFLYITGRLSDIIISGEENICAKEVEDCIRQLDEDVADVAVVGLPSRKWGEIVVAAVVRRSGSTVTDEIIVQHCRHTIASYKKPRHVLFWETLPVNACGKTIKKRVRERALQELEEEYEL